MTVLSAGLLLAHAAWSLELFEGNLGTDGEWLHVIGAGAMSDRVQWQDLGPDFTYEVHFATDDTFLSLVSMESGISNNWVEPRLDPGFYSFRVREVDASGAPGTWSDPGFLHVVEDLEWPEAEIVSPVSGTLQPGATLTVELEVSDDTVLHLARFEIDGEYAGAVGLKTEAYKVAPSFGEPRTVTFDYPIAEGKAGFLELSVIVSDVTYKQVVVTQRFDLEAGSSSRKTRRGRKK